MIIEINMPVLGLTMEEGTIVEWNKAEGDKVAVDETILVVETDKATSDVPSPGSGILARIVAKDGETIPVGQVIAYLAETESDLANVPQGPAGATPAPSSALAPSPPAPVAAEVLAGIVAPGQPIFASPRARAKAGALGVDLAAVPFGGKRITEDDVVKAAATGPAGAPQARLTPLATRIAAELGIDLTALGASPEARIKAADLLLAATLAPEGAAGRPGVSASTLGRALSPAPVPDFATGDIRLLGRVRRITAERMTYSSQTAPQVTYTMRCDMSKAVDFRNDLKPVAEARGLRLSFDAMFVRAAATALLEFPEANAQWVEGQGIRLSAEAHVGVAVDLGKDGLIVPVVRNANNLELFTIAEELERLVKAAREGKLGPDDYKGGTFTISNLGLLGVETFTPVINLPEAAILAIGAITPTPVFVEGRLTERQIAVIAVTTDHRVLDGAPSARFLSRIRDLMEHPLMLL